LRSAEPAKPNIALWWGRLDVDPARLIALQATLSRAEQHRAARYLSDRARIRFVAGRGQLRMLLARELQCRPSEVEISGAEHAKPYLPGSELRFNLAHSEDTALYALSWTNEVGVDVEHVIERPGLEGVAQRYLSPAERCSLAALPAVARTRGLYECWTHKEAFLKGTGEGLDGQIDNVTAWVGPNTPAFVGRWLIQTVGVSPQTVAAVAVRDAPTWRPPADVRSVSASYKVLFDRQSACE
jgi:4'-phosphopantetheinyl transferase